MTVSVVLKNDGPEDVRVMHVLRGNPSVGMREHVKESRVLKSKDELGFWLGDKSYIQVEKY